MVSVEGKGAGPAWHAAAFAPLLDSLLCAFLEASEGKKGGRRASERSGSSSEVVGMAGLCSGLSLVGSVACPGPPGGHPPPV